MLLLDEPSSGLDHHETEAFAAILASLVRERGTGILLVEHDMTLVMSISAHLYVLDFGRVIFEGPPAAAQESQVVREAYLGAST
jgi:ABC-type branched-subunit amino acid transport system ATPase component